MDDIDRIVESEHAQNAVDHPHYRVNREDIVDDFTHSWVDLERDTMLAIARDGTVAAWGQASIGQGQETAVRAFLFGGVHPDHRGRGIGRALFAWTEGRCLELLAASEKALPGVLEVYADERQLGLIALAERFGFTIARFFQELHRDVREPIEPRVLEGYRVVTLDEVDSDAVRLARNDAFRDHWGSQPTVPEAWSSFLARSVVRPDLSFIAVDHAGEIGGFVLSEVDEDDFEVQGFTGAYIDLVGVPRAHRGRGIASALLTRTLEAIAAAGLERAILDVDSESLTGATRLYENVGFKPAHRSLSMRKEV